VLQSQDFDVIATHTVNGDVVLVQDQLTCARDPASPAHARMGLELGHGILQLQHKTGRAGRIVFGDEPGDFIDGWKRRLGPLDGRGSSAVFGEHCLHQVEGRVERARGRPRAVTYCLKTADDRDHAFGRSSMDRFDVMRAYVQVVESSSFTGAARR
jgi:hypothetical protein